MKEKTKRKLRFPSAMAILLGVIVFAVIMTYLVPGGTFSSHIDPVTGQEVTTLEDFSYTEVTPISPLEIPVRIVSAFSSGSTATIVLTYLFMGGGIYILTQSGSFQAVIGWALQRLKGNRFLMVAGFTVLLSACNMVLSPHAFVAFVPFSIWFAGALGYDAMVGVAMPLLGGAVAFSTGALLATTMMAQTLVGLPIFSGAAYRVVCMVILLIPTIIYIYRYGEAVRLKKRESVCPLSNGSGEEDTASSQVKPRHILAVGLFLGTMAGVIIGTTKYGWSNLELSAAFMVLGIVVALLFGNSLDQAMRMYIEGAKTMIPAAVLAGLAGTAAGIMTSGGIMYTIVYHASRLILSVPKVLYAPMMFTMHLLINCVIVSGGGQAAATMPIMGSIAQFCGIPMQSAVLTYNLGDGLGNYVLPHSNQLISYLEAGKVSYGQWMRFMWKLFVIWVVFAWILTAISVAVWGA